MSKKSKKMKKVKGAPAWKRALTWSGLIVTTAITGLGALVIADILIGGEQPVNSRKGENLGCCRGYWHDEDEHEDKDDYCWDCGEEKSKYGCGFNSCYYGDD